MIGDKWTLLVARDLAAGPKRTMELHSGLFPISSRTLVGRLRDMEKDQLLERTDFGGNPPHISMRSPSAGGCSCLWWMPYECSANRWIVMNVRIERSILGFTARPVLVTLKVLNLSPSRGRLLYHGAASETIQSFCCSNEAGSRATYERLRRSTVRKAFPGRWFLEYFS